MDRWWITYWYKNKIIEFANGEYDHIQEDYGFGEWDHDLQKKVMKLEVIDKTKGIDKFKLFAIVLVGIFVWFIFM